MCDFKIIIKYINLIEKNILNTLNYRNIKIIRIFYCHQPQSAPHKNYKFGKYIYIYIYIYVYIYIYIYIYICLSLKLKYQILNIKYGINPHTNLYMINKIKLVINKYSF